MTQQLNVCPRFFLASYIHKTETEEGLLFDRATAWQVAIHQDNANVLVVQKCSQVGITVVAIIRMINWLREGKSGLYVLPTKVMMETFVKNRIDPPLEDVSYYRNNYATKRTDAKGSQLKTLFNRRIKFAGSNVKNQFFEFPAGFYVVDEHDLCDANNLRYLDDRLGRQKVKLKMIIGNPTLDKRGINELFDASDRKEWFVTCGHCGTEQVLTWHDNCVRQVAPKKYVLRDRLVQAQINKELKHERLPIAVEMVKDRAAKLGRDARIYCKSADCNKPIDRHGQGRWIAQRPDRPVSGYHISKIFGDPYAPAILTLFNKFIRSQHMPMAMQHFMNSELGLPYEESGNRVTESLLADCAREYEIPYKMPTQLLQNDLTWTVCGVDVGDVLHVHISAMWVDNHELRLCKILAQTIGGGVNDAAFDDLDKLVKRYNCISGVIDALPEKRLSRKFVRNHRNWWMAFYNKSDTKKDYVKDEKGRTLSLDRTEALDMSLAAYASKERILPMHFRSLDNGDFLEQMRNPLRFFDDKGIPHWSRSANEAGEAMASGADHHRHADTYEYFAAMLARTWGGMKVQA